MAETYFECGICGKRFRKEEDAKKCNHVKKVETRGDPIVKLHE